MGDNTDADQFPAPAYRDTVLAPLFDGVKRYHWAYLMRINFAHAVMLGGCGLLNEIEKTSILSGLAEIIDGLDFESLAYTGEHEDFYFYVVAELTRRIGSDVAGKLHTGRSRNDIDHTVFKMALKDRCFDYLSRLLDLVEGLIALAARNRTTLVVAYTHGQPAQPTTYGHYLAAFIEVLQRDVGRLLHAVETLDRCSMGAAAITTSGFGLDRARIADLLGFAEVQENSYGCISACDYITETYAAMKVHFLNVGRFAQDLNVWTGFEIGHLHVPDGFVQISSIMPQKRNPVPVEHLRLMASLAGGRCDMVLTTMHNTPFTDMNDAEGEVQIAGYEVFETGNRVLGLLGPLMQSIRVDEARVRQHIAESCITITEVADSLVRREGITAAQGHRVASRMARQLIDAKMSFADLDFASFTTMFMKVVGRPPVITPEDLRQFATPEHFVAVRTMFGGPSPAVLDESLGRYRERLALDRLALAAHVDRVKAANKLLDELVAGAVAAQA